MKKNVILLSVLSFVLLFASCKKDKTINEMKNTDPTEQKILSFKAKLQNPEKNNETMHIDSAVWYIEAALNYTYCFISNKKQYFYTDSVTLDSVILDFNNDDNYIPFVDVANIYNNVKNIIISKFNSLNKPAKYYDFIDVSFADKKFKIYYSFSIHTENRNNKSITFWSSAPPVIYKRANKFVAYPNVGSGYFTDIDSLYRAPYWYFATNDNPYGDYLLFYKRIYTGYPEPYLSDAEMNYYSNSVLEALNIAKSDIPSGYTFKAWRLDSEGWTIHDGYDHLLHYIIVRYGILHNGGSQSN